MADLRNSGRAGPWWEVGEVAGRQHGVVSRDQLRAAGLTEAEIHHAVASGRLHRIFREAFGLGHAQVGWHGRLIAATLACGEGTVVSHGTAAALLGLWEHQPLDVDVIAPVEAGRKISGIVRRHVPLPLPRDHFEWQSIPCTSPSRTIVDVAGFRKEWLLSDTIEQAAVQQMLDVAEIYAILDGPRRVGSRLLRVVLEDWRRYPRGVRVRSRLEAKLLPLLSRYALPIPAFNLKVRIGGEPFEFDVCWPRQRLVIEADSEKFHGNPVAKARDAHRDRIFSAAGYRVYRLGWDDVTKRPAATAAEIRHLLATSVRSPRSAVP